ncbi:SpoIIE family protein phosphatase [Streptomyces sp. NRRL S-813]|uniref:SpoIIE family protein phosphatase n=1 Tax=Streptomyces sp. NRRL S-813 TaxID=1463919 RepID=UPI0006911ADB|nr:SpoIIE family protein phosphatase [Streptomyces sp. NRRL S-813]
MTARIPAGLDGILRTASTAGRATLESLVSRPGVGLAVWDTDLHCVWVNAELGRQDGIPAPRRQGRRPSQALRGDADALETVMQQVLADGAPVIGREYRVPAVRGGRPERALTVSFFRLDDTDGRPLGVCSLVQDPAGRRWTGRRLALLSEAATSIGTTLDVMRTGQELADFAVPFLADYVTVELTEAVRLGAEPLDRLGPTGGRIPVFRRAGLASVRPGAPESLWDRGEAVYVAETSPFTQVLSSGCSLLEPDLARSTRARLDLDPARAEKIRTYGMHSLMVVPMHARGVLLGVAVFVRSDNPAPFDEEDLLLAEELVRRAALSLDNARRYTRERTAALALQRSLLPRHVTGGAALDVVTRYLPADAEDGVGGDWFDVIPLPGARVALVVGDVVGHGLDAAATMGRLRMAVRTLAELDLPPGDLLSHLNEVVSRLAQEDPAEDPPASSVGATCLYAVYDPVTRTCVTARAGHPPPAILRPDGKVSVPDVPAGTPLGLATLPYESTELELPEGSVIALFSDGLIEDRRHDIDEGIDRISTHLAQPGVTLEELSHVLIDTMPATRPSDDVTLLLARTRSLGPHDTASWELPADTASAGTARSLATRQLARWGLEKLAPTTELIVSELVTNAILHAKGPIRLHLIRHQALVCEVTDAGTTAPRLHHAQPYDESGRGLFLVAQLARRWGTRHTPGGKLVWAEQAIPRRP